MTTGKIMLGYTFWQICSTMNVLQAARARTFDPLFRRTLEDHIRTLAKSANLAGVVGYDPASVQQKLDDGQPFSIPNIYGDPRTPFRVRFANGSMYHTISLEQAWERHDYEHNHGTRHHVVEVRLKDGQWRTVERTRSGPA